MPNIPVGAQVFDLVFHPTDPLVAVGLLTGEVKAFSYDEQGNYEERFSVRPSKRSCRGLAMDGSGDKMWAVGKGKSISTLDTRRGKLVEMRKSAHDAAINRVKSLLPNLFCTGDDDGVLKLWDPRKPESDPLKTYTHHYDFISDFLWLEDKKQLVVTSGDGTLSVIDVRSKKTEPVAQSEDQEDELLSLVTIKGGQKVIVGTQLGILSVFNRKSGWGDCVDRIPGHPHSIDALCNIPSRYPNSQSTILTGSSDGILRAVQLLPTKLLGVVADHGEFPIERIAVDQGGEGRWVGSVGHEEMLKLTDLQEVFEDDGSEEEEEDSEAGDSDDGGNAEENKAEDDGSEEEDIEGNIGKAKGKSKAAKSDGEDSDEEEDSDNEEEKDDGVQEQDGNGQPEDADSSDEEVFESKKRKKKPEKDPLQAMTRKKGRNELVTDSSFFADL